MDWRRCSGRCFNGANGSVGGHYFGAESDALDDLFPAAAPRVHNAIERGMNCPKIIESPYRRHCGTSTILIEGCL